jgi:hypothetical protein
MRMYNQVCQEIKGEKRVRKDRAKAYQETFSLKVQLQKERRSKDKYKGLQHIKTNIEKETDNILRKGNIKRTILHSI